MLELSRKDFTEACERAQVWGSVTVDPHQGRGATGPGLTLPVAKVNDFLAAMALIMADGGRSSDAVHLVARVRTEPQGRGVMAFWPDAVLVD